MKSKQYLNKLRAVFKRYGSEVLGDPSVTVGFFPTEFDEFVEVLLTSPKFESMSDAERQDSIWDYLRSAPELVNQDLFYISQIATETEEVESI